MEECVNFGQPFDVISNLINVNNASARPIVVDRVTATNMCVFNAHVKYEHTHTRHLNTIDINFEFVVVSNFIYCSRL